MIAFDEDVGVPLATELAFEYDTGVPVTNDIHFVKPDQKTNQHTVKKKKKNNGMWPVEIKSTSNIFIDVDG